MKVQEDTIALREEIILPLNRLRSIRIDTSVFSKPEYVALMNMSVELQEPQLERSNPFAPVERF